MDKAIRMVKLFAIFLIFILLGTEANSGGFQKRRSQTWSGPCFSDGKCDGQCRERENADRGDCRGTFFACSCYFEIDNDKEGNSEGYHKRRSQTWAGPCFFDDKCDKQCREKEDADYGDCRGTIYACSCYFRNNNDTASHP